MSVITKVEFSHPDMALADTIQAHPEVSIRVVPEAGTDPEHDRYFFRVQEGEFEGIEASLEADHTVADDLLTSRYDDQWVFGIQFTPETKLLSPRVTDQGGMALEARTSRGGWIERWQLPDRSALNEVWKFAREESFQFDILELHRTDGFSETSGLTDAQYETLVAAHEAGYFEEPRGIDLAGLAEELDVSPSAASGRLRRGTARLIELTLGEGERG